MRKIKEVLRLKFEARWSHERIAATKGLTAPRITRLQAKSLDVSFAQHMSLGIPRADADGFAVARLASRPTPRLGAQSRRSPRGDDRVRLRDLKLDDESIATPVTASAAGDGPVAPLDHRNAAFTFEHIDNIATAPSDEYAKVWMRNSDNEYRQILSTRTTVPAFLDEAHSTLRST